MESCDIDLYIELALHQHNYLIQFIYNAQDGLSSIRREWEQSLSRHGFIFETEPMLYGGTEVVFLRITGTRPLLINFAEAFGIVRGIQVGTLLDLYRRSVFQISNNPKCHLLRNSEHRRIKDVFRESILDDEKVFIPFLKERVPFFTTYNSPTRPLFTDAEKVHLVR